MTWRTTSLTVQTVKPRKVIEGELDGTNGRTHERKDSAEDLTTLAGDDTTVTNSLRNTVTFVPATMF
jgi:hypothetical protein